MSIETNIERIAKALERVATALENEDKHGVSDSGFDEGAAADAVAQAQTKSKPAKGGKKRETAAPEPKMTELPPEEKAPVEDAPEAEKQPAAEPESEPSAETSKPASEKEDTDKVLSVAEVQAEAIKIAEKIGRQPVVDAIRDAGVSKISEMDETGLQDFIASLRALAADHAEA